MSKNFELGKEYLEKEEYTKAIEFFTKALEENDDAETYRLIGWSYFMLDDDSTALKYYDKATSIDPKYAKPYYNRGWMFHYSKNYPMAIKEYDTALELDPKYALVYTRRGAVHTLLGRFDLALSDYQEALKLNPKDPNAYKDVGLLLSFTGKDVEGLEILFKAVELNLVNADIYDNIGLIYQKFGDYEKAVKYSVMAHNQDPKNDIIKEHYDTNKEMLEGAKKRVSWYLPVYDFETKSYLLDFEGSCKFLKKNRWDNLNCGLYPHLAENGNLTINDLEKEKLPDNTIIASHCKNNVCKWEILEKFKEEKPSVIELGNSNTPVKNQEIEKKENIKEQSSNIKHQSSDRGNKPFCTKCGNKIDTDANFCTKCGNKIAVEPVICSNCGNEIEAEANFCTKCGNSVQPPLHDYDIIFGYRKSDVGGNIVQRPFQKTPKVIKPTPYRQTFRLKSPQPFPKSSGLKTLKQQKHKPKQKKSFESIKIMSIIGILLVICAIFVINIDNHNAQKRIQRHLRKVPLVNELYLYPDLQSIPIRERETVFNTTIDIINSRLKLSDIPNYSVHSESDYRIVVQLPEMSEQDMKRYLELVGKMGMLSFQLVATNEDTRRVISQMDNWLSQNRRRYPFLNDMYQGDIFSYLTVSGYYSSMSVNQNYKQMARLLLNDDDFKNAVPAGYQILLGIENVAIRRNDLGIYVVYSNYEITGSSIRGARVLEQEKGRPYVMIRFDREGARTFERLTAQNIGRNLAIVFDGVVYTAPVIQDRISGGEAMITGNFTSEECNDLSNILKSGSYPVPIQIGEMISIK